MIMKTIIATFGMVYRNKNKKSIFGKYIELKNNDTEDNWELVYEEIVEEYLKNNNIIL